MCHTKLYLSGETRRQQLPQCCRATATAHHPQISEPRNLATCISIAKASVRLAVVNQHSQRPDPASRYLPSDLHGPGARRHQPLSPNSGSPHAPASQSMHSPTVSNSYVAAGRSSSGNQQLHVMFGQTLVTPSTLKVVAVRSNHDCQCADGNRPLGHLSEWKK